jgi:hypothetical protein
MTTEGTAAAWGEPQIDEPHVLEPPTERPAGLSCPGTSASTPMTTVPIPLDRVREHLRVSTVGKMVRTLVTVVGSPAAAWIRPATTEPAPATATIHPSVRLGRMPCCRVGRPEALAGRGGAPAVPLVAK